MIISICSTLPIKRTISNTKDLFAYIGRSQTVILLLLVTCLDALIGCSITSSSFSLDLCSSFLIFIFFLLFWKISSSSFLAVSSLISLVSCLEFVIFGNVIISLTCSSTWLSSKINLAYLKSSFFVSRFFFISSYPFLQSNISIYYKFSYSNLSKIFFKWIFLLILKH